MTDQEQEPWPEKMYLLHPSIKTFGAMVSNPERREYVRADLIEEVVKERDDYKDLYYAGFKDAASLNIHYAEVGYKAKTAEAKLAKAVEMLILCGDMFDEVAHPSDPLSVMIKTTLAELRGKE